MGKYICNENSLPIMEMTENSKNKRAGDISVHKWNSVN